MNKTEKNWSPETPATCPVSGLPVTRRPAWNDIDLGKGYLVSFEFIGDRMLLSRSMGWKNASRQSIKQLFRERRKVLGQMLDRNEPFVELRDYSHFEGLSSKESRDQFIAEIAKDKDRVMAFIGFNAPKAVQIAFNVWSRLFHAPFPISIAKDYPAALKKALAAIGPTVQSLDRSGQKVVKFPQYTYSSGNFRVEFEIIENRIVHSNAKGIYTPKDVAPSTAYLGRVCAHVEKIWQRSYFINGVTELDLSSYKTRVKYLGKIKQWHTNFPNFNAIVFYGANRWIKAGIHLTKHLVPFKVKIVDDLESALAYIKVRDSSHSRNSDTALPTAKSSAYRRPLHEILEFLGSISWGNRNSDIPDPPLQSDSSFAPVYDAISLIKMDLDELERDRQQSENQRQILAKAIEQSTDCITITDAAGDILYVNPAFSRITGYSQMEATGRPIAFISNDGKSITRLNTLWQDVARDQPAKQQITCHKKDGTPYLADTTVSQIISSDDETINFVTVQRNVTHEVQLEAQLKQIHKMEAIGTLAGGIAHDFNNILFPIIGYTEMSLDEAAPGSQVARNLKEILQAATRAKQLVKQILTFSRQDSSTRKPIDLVPVIKEAVSLLRASIPATVEIKQIYQQGVGRALADPTQIHQVIVNLGSNAFHAMRETGGVMTIALKETVAAKTPGETGITSPGLPPGNYLKLSVTDSGSGMPPEISTQIFDPFFTTKEMATNTGLGLSMIHSIVTGHDGRIIVASEPGKGTTFDIYLPEINAPPARESHVSNKAAAALPTGRGRILIVDDEIQSSKIIQKFVSSLGYDTACFTHCRKALDYFRAQHKVIDLVIADLVMPDMTGDVLAEELIKINPELPVIICTGHREMLDKADTTKIRDILIKPVSRNDLARATQHALTETHSRN